MTATTATLFETLRRETAALHQRTLDHPTVRGIGDGTLPESSFRFYLEQDFQFLLRFVRVLAITASSANELETMAQLSRLVTSTVDVEIDALRDIYASFGGDPSTLDAVEPAPTCEAYCNHLLAVVHERNPLVSIAAFLPCHWGYHDIGLHLRRRGLPADTRYAAWIEEYASDQYGELVHWVIERFNELGSQASAADLKSASRAFELSARYEYGFWEMAWTHERWPEAVTSG
jgi:thiaminase/transcriptional activator TenA